MCSSVHLGDNFICSCIIYITLISNYRLHRLRDKHKDFKKQLVRKSSHQFDFRDLELQYIGIRFYTFTINIKYVNCIQSLSYRL